MAVTPTTNQTTPNGYDPNSVADYAVKNKLVTAWNPQNAASLFEKQGLGTAAQYLSAGKNNSAYNMALLTKLKGGYSGTTKSGTISGSGSVTQNQKTGSALSSASESLSPAKVPTTPDKQPVPQTATTVDPQVQAYQDQASTAKNQASQDYQVQIQPLMDAHATSVQQLQTEKDKAIAAAKDTWRRATGGAQVAGEDDYVANVAAQYDTQIQNANNSFNEQTAQITQAYHDNLNTIDSNTSTAIANYKEQSFTDAEKMISTSPIDPNKATFAQMKPYIEKLMGSGMSMEDAVSYLSVASKGILQEQEAQNRLALAQTRAANAETNALNTQSRLDRTAAVSNVNTAVDNFTKAGTPGQQLNNASSYMSSIEAASQSGGSGVSALSLIDAIVKLDTGGQAIREGQVNILQKSGTYSDSMNTFLQKFQKDNGSIGSNTVLSPGQVSQIQSFAKTLANEKINSAIQQYKDLKRGVQETKNAYPGTEGIVDATANLGNIDTFINNYSDDYHVDESSGTLYHKIGGNWVPQ